MNNQKSVQSETSDVATPVSERSIEKPPENEKEPKISEYQDAPVKIAVKPEAVKF